ncbi:polyphosphate polymerase domain-containing protein [Dactylosporangium sp. CA-139114]|uniref:polyphosphate polymerase domain-containing protein n=1 Tax=Dactylosporangium sp. CA-139114 TaxID=3239931 RepID=UPI003D99606E
MTAALMRLDDLPPISLDELQAGAALLTRVDRKYLLPTELVPLLLGELPTGVRALQIGDRRQFTYRSDYFDTPGLDAYLAAAHRRRRRGKVRVRTYLDSGDRFVEIKTRGPRGATVKHRMPYTGDPAELDPTARLYIDVTLLGAALAPCAPDLRPALTTWYQRTTLYLPRSGSRVTVDTGLRWALPDGSALSLPGSAVVETKTASAASDADRLLWRLGHRPCAMSKYATGLAALRPDLPTNRWCRVLRRHFPTQESR